MIKVAVLASGGGTNLQAIIDVIENRELTGITISMVLSDNEDSYALERAKKNNIPTEVIKKSEYTVREDYDKVLVERLNKYEIELVVLAGFMRLLSPVMTKAFPLRIINIHPSLLPSFPGLDVQRKAIEYGAKFSGATVHFVDNGVDTGPIILQGTVPVKDDDTEESLSKRIWEIEHKLYPKAIGLFAKGRLVVDGRRVTIKDE